MLQKEKKFFLFGIDVTKTKYLQKAFPTIWDHKWTAKKFTSILKKMCFFSSLMGKTLTGFSDYKGGSKK